MVLVGLVDHDDHSRRRLTRLLIAGGFEVMAAADELEGLRTACEVHPDALLVHLHSGRYSGVEFVRILRAACDVPVLGLALDPSSSDVVAALDAGADDVLPEDCGAPELLARIRAAVRRYQRNGSPALPLQRVRTGNIEIDRDARTVMRDGEPVQLSRIEFKLLDALAARLGQTAPHRYLLSTVWGEEYVDDTHYLRVYIGYLRAKLEDNPSVPQYLLNEWGVGYRLERLPLSERPVRQAHSNDHPAALF